MGTSVLARLQSVYVVLNVLSVIFHFVAVIVPITKSLPSSFRSVRLCLAVIVALPAATPSELKNSASFALGGFTNC